MKSFGNLKFQPAQQGELDALCGVYAAANFLFRRFGLQKDGEERWDQFRILLKYLERAGNFNVAKVCQGGYSASQIRAAFNKTAKELKLSVKATKLSSAMKKKGIKDLYAFLKSLDNDEAVLIKLDEWHWILMHSAGRGFVVIDDGYPPAVGRAKCTKVSKSDKRFEKINLNDGLAFLNA